MKTRSELMAEMQAHADYINGDDAYNKISVEDYSAGLLGFYVGVVRVGTRRAYRPDPVAPVDGRAVIVGTLGKIRVSRGTFSNNGYLQTYEDVGSGYSGDDRWANWCDFLNRDHHSPGWRKEWEPKE